jgi:2'-5' RNA ligase
MRALAETLARELDARGFEPDEHAFSPHLTLGRVRVPGDWTSPLLTAPPLDVPFEVTRIELVRSTLARGGSRYDVVGEAPLAG